MSQENKQEIPTQNNQQETKSEPIENEYNRTDVFFTISEPEQKQETDKKPQIPMFDFTQME